MHPRIARHPASSALALAIAAALLLGACASSGGSTGGSTLVVGAPPPPPPPTLPPPPPPPTRAQVLPAAPLPSVEPSPPALAGTADVVVDAPMEGTSVIPTSSSSGSLTKTGPGRLFVANDLRFDAGATVAQGELYVWYANLFADVTVAPGAALHIRGDIVGDVLNNGLFLPMDDGNGWYEDFYDGDIFGDYTQGPAGVLQLYFGMEGDTAPMPLLTVSGHASLDGQLQFLRSGFVPSTGYLEWVLHAFGGVSGRFAGWSAGSLGSPLFLTGTLEYGPNDVWFSATRASIEGTLTGASVGDALTLASAAHVDKAFAVGDALVAAPAGQLSLTQRRFLASAASLQRIDDLDRAVSAFDSLSGQGHAALAAALLDEAAEAGPAASVHAAGVAPGAGEHRWSARPGLRPQGEGLFVDEGAGGVDRWRSDRLLVGSRFGWSRGDLAFERGGGHARDRSPRWDLYLRREGDGGRYAFASLGLSHHQIELERLVDVGEGARRAQSTRTLELAHAYVEGGRAVDVGGHRFTAFAGLNVAALRAGAFAEQGTTGFELTAPTTWRQQLGLDLGLRQARTWRLDGGRWLQLGSGVTWRQPLASRGDLRAAFTGAPAATFDLSPVDPAARAIARLDLLGGGERWAWQLQLDAQAGRDAASASLVRLFR